MWNMFMSNLPPIGESVAKLASKGSQLMLDQISVFGFFAFCLLFVGFSLISPVLFEKYFHVADDEPSEIDLEQQEANSVA